MALTDFITGAAAQRAARNNIGVIGQTLDQGSGAILGGYAQASDNLLSGTNPSAISSLGANYGQARTDLGTQYGETQGYLGQLRGLYDPLVSSGQQATDARLDALGLNGADGTARAKTAFQNSLGYGAGLETGLDAVMRSASARGNLAGGNTSADLFRYGADYQNQQAGSYFDRLTGLSGNLNTGLAGQAAGLGAQASASANQGSALSQLGQSLGQAQAGVFGQNANLNAQKGTSLAGLQTGAAQALIGNNNALSAAQNQTGLNLANLFLGATRAVTGQGGIAGLFR